MTSSTEHQTSSLYGLNPLSKLAWTVGLVVLAFILSHPAYLLALLVGVVAVAIAAKTGRQIAPVMRWSLFLCIPIIVVNVAVTYHGSHVLWEAPFALPALGTPRLTLEAIVSGLANCLRLLAIVLAFAVLNATTAQEDLVQAMGKLRLPERSVLAASLSMRFVPTLARDAQRIAQVQQARGVDMEQGNLLKRIQSRGALLVPLLCNSLDRAIGVAEAMEARGFGSDRPRTAYRRLRFTLIDFATLAVIGGATLFGVWLCVAGHADFQYYPTVSSLGLTPMDALLLALLSATILALVPLAHLKRRIDLD